MLYTGHLSVHPGDLQLLARPVRRAARHDKLRFSSLKVTSLQHLQHAWSDDAFKLRRSSTFRLLQFQDSKDLIHIRLVSLDFYIQIDTRRIIVIINNRTVFVK